MRKKLVLITALLISAMGMRANSEVYLEKQATNAAASTTVTFTVSSEATYNVNGVYTLATTQLPNTGYDYTLFSLPYTELAEYLGLVSATSSDVTVYYPTTTSGTYATKGDNWFTSDGKISSWSTTGDNVSRFFIQEITEDADNFIFWVGQHGVSGHTSSVGNTHSATFYIVNGTNAVEVNVTLYVAGLPKLGTATSWTSASTTPKISAGDYVQLEGLKMTLGNSDDASTTWSWNAGNSGIIPSQMPSTAGTSATLVTSFSTTSPFGTLPTRGNYFKIEPTKNGKVTITCKPSTGSGQNLVFVTMDESDATTVAAAKSSSSTSSTSFTYNVAAGRTYYFFQLAYSGQLSGYRFTLRGVSFAADREPEQINSSSSDLAWTSTSEAASIVPGDYVQLNGVKLTFGNQADENTTWTWNAGNAGMLPAQMPSTDGTAATLITEFSEESPFGTLPTRGNFFKLEATQDGLVTITCKPSTDAAQKLVFVEMNGENIAKATVNTSIWNDYYNYEVEAGKTYYVFQLSKSGNLSGYRYTFRGISFQSQILDEDAAYTPASMVGISALTLKRTLKKDKWNTIVLPVDLTNAQLKAAFGANVKVAELTGASENELTFSSVTETAANQPYMIYVDEDFSGEYTFTGITVVSNTPSQTVSEASFIGSYTAETSIPTGSYFVSDNSLVKAADGSNKMKGTRAYFNVPAAGSVKALRFIINDDITTGIERPTMHNGAGAVYDLSGRRMVNGKLTQGLYIVNGKKVMVK